MIGKYVRFPSISAFAEMTKLQFEFLMESIRWKNQQVVEQVDAIAEAENEAQELKDTLKRLDILEGKNAF